MNKFTSEQLTWMIIIGMLTLSGTILGTSAIFLNYLR